MENITGEWMHLLSPTEIHGGKDFETIIDPALVNDRNRHVAVFFKYMTGKRPQKIDKFLYIDHLLSEMNKNKIPEHIFDEQPLVDKRKSQRYYWQALSKRHPANQWLYEFVGCCPKYYDTAMLSRCAQNIVVRDRNSNDSIVAKKTVFIYRPDETDIYHAPQRSLVLPRTIKRGLKELGL